MPTQSRPNSRGTPPDGEPLCIGFYAPALPDSGLSNGIVTYTRIMRDALRSQGHSVVVVTTEVIEGPDGEVAELPKPKWLRGHVRSFLESRRRDGSHPWVRLRILDAFAAARHSGVQVFELEESFGWAGRLTGKGIAIVERLHGPHIFVRDQIEPAQVKRSGDLREAAEFASFGRVQAVTAPTEGLREALLRYGLDPSIASVIPNPMPAAPPADCWSVERADPNQLLFVGRFDLCKGADIAIRAFAQAAAERPLLKLVIVGPNNGLARSDGRLSKFEEFIAAEVSADVRARIHFVGPQSPGAIGRLRKESALALVTSRFETFGYNIAEAMAVGMPVLTSATFGGETLIGHGLDGLVVPVGDVAATARGILQMTTDREALARMGRSAHRRVADQLSPERIARDTVEVYRRAMARL